MYRFNYALFVICMYARMYDDLNVSLRIQVSSHGG